MPGHDGCSASGYSLPRKPRRHLLLAVWRKAHDPRFGLEHRPAPRYDVIEHGRTQGAAEMASPLAPVEAGAAQRPPAAVQRLDIDAGAFEEVPALAGQPQLVAAASKQ